MEIPNEYAVATLHWSLAGAATPISVTHACNYADEEASPNEQCESIYSYFTVGDTPCFPALMLVGWSFLGVSILARTQGGALVSGAKYTTIAGTGTHSAPLVPSYSPLVVTKRTEFSGVAQRGRMYPPATTLLASDVAYSGEINASLAAGIQGLWENAFTLWTANPSLYPVLLHGPPQGGGGTPTPTPVTSWQVQGNVATQRRRKNRA